MRGHRPPPCSAHRSHRRARISGTAAGSRGAHRGSPHRPGALPCTAKINGTTINQETCTFLNQPNGRGVFKPHKLEASRGRGTRAVEHGEVHETLESSIVGSCLVCMISPSSCTTISRLGPGYYKAYRHIFYTPSVPKCTPSVRNYLSRKWMYLALKYV